MAMKLVLCIGLNQRARDGQSILKQETYSHVYKHHCSRDISHTVSWFLYSMSQRERRVGAGRQEGSSFSLSWLGGGGGETFIFVGLGCWVSVIGCRCRLSAVVYLWMVLGCQVAVFEN
jgi:hypothetical protein